MLEEELGQEFMLQLKDPVSKEQDQERKLNTPVLCKISSGLQVKISSFDSKSKVVRRLESENTITIWPSTSKTRMNH